MRMNSTGPGRISSGKSKPAMMPSQRVVLTRASYRRSTRSEMHGAMPFARRIPFAGLYFRATDSKHAD